MVCLRQNGGCIGADTEESRMTHHCLPGVASDNVQRQGKQSKDSGCCADRI